MIKFLQVLNFGMKLKYILSFAVVSNYANEITYVVPLPSY